MEEENSNIQLSEKDYDCLEINVLPVASSGCYNSCSIWSIQKNRRVKQSEERGYRRSLQNTDVSSIGLWKLWNKIDKFTTFYH